jgi:hypothetical protein
MALWLTLAQGVEAVNDACLLGRPLGPDRRGMSFHYTLSALIEACVNAALDVAFSELRHARVAIERRLGRSVRSSAPVHAHRRRALCERALQAVA